MIGPYPQMECNPQFCPAVLGGPQPGDCQLKFLGQNETHKKAEDVPLRERINNQCVLKSEFTSHNSKILVLQFFFFFFLPVNLDLERKGQREILPSSMDQAPQMEEPPLIRILTLCRLWPVFPGSLVQTPEGARCPSVLVLVTRY